VTGKLCENIVKIYFLSKQQTLLAERLRLKYGEVDLIFSSENSVLLVEVKSLSNEWGSFDRISPAQVNRLRLNRIFLSHVYSKLTFQTQLAFVDPKKASGAGIQLVDIE